MDLEVKYMRKFTSKRNKEFWNQYAKKSQDNPFGAHSDSHVVELENGFIINQIKEKNFKKLLDIGCGNGQRTLVFSRYISKKILGIDYSKDMIKESLNLLEKQSLKIKEKLSFKEWDINKYNLEETFDVIISCRCFINQPSYSHQLKLFKKLYTLLKKGGSLIIAEESIKGIKNLNSMRKKFGLDSIKIRWHNLPIDEDKMFSELKPLFTIKKINRLGTFYYVSRMLYPKLIFPKEPDPNSKINDIGLETELILQREIEANQNPLEKYGAPLLVHFIKK